MTDPTTPEEYNKIYTANPNLWTGNKDRYITASAMIAQVFHGIPKSLLDVGCGTGEFIEFIHTMWPNTRLYGMDLSSVAIHVAMKRLGDSVGFMLMDLHTQVTKHFLPALEAITFLGTLEHIEDLGQAMDDIDTMLVPGGVVFIEIPHNLAYPTSTHKEGFRKLNQGSRQVEWHLKRETWEKIFIDAGFKIALFQTGNTVYTEFNWILTLI